MGVPVPRPGLMAEYEQYLGAVEEYNRKVMTESGCPQSYVESVISAANLAPRCEHIRAEGLRCHAPALHGRTLCYAHTRMAASKKAGLQLPALENASGIALAVMQVVQQLLDGKLDRKTAVATLYGIQIVASTLSHKPFAATPTSVVLEAAGLPPEEELLGVSDSVKGTGEGPGAPPDTCRENIELREKIKRGLGNTAGGAARHCRENIARQPRQETSGIGIRQPRTNRDA